MSVIGEVIGIVACVAAVVSAYKDGSQIVQRIKDKRRRTNADPPSRYLEESLDRGATAVEQTHNAGVDRFGTAFKDGDDAALNALRDITIQLQQSMLRELSKALEDDSRQDFTDVVNASDTARLRTVNVLNDLFLRMQAAASRDRSLTPATADRNRIQMGVIVSPSPQLHNEEGRSPPLGRVYTLPDNYGSEALQRSYRISRSSAPKQTSESTALNYIPGISGLFPRRKKFGDKPDAMRRDSRLVGKDVQPVARSIPQDPRRPKQGQLKSEMSTSISLGPDPSAMSIEIGMRTSPEEIEKSRRRYTNQDRIALDANLSPLLDNEPIAQALRGFCKGAYYLQVRLKSDGMKLRNQSSSFLGEKYYYACSNSKCCFEAPAQKAGKVWDLASAVFGPRYAVKFRWSFLAKSHIEQSKAKKLNFQYRCIFCALRNPESPILEGVDSLIEHVAQHRREELSTEGRVLIDGDDFDIHFVADVPVDPASSVPSHSISPIQGESLWSIDIDDNPWRKEPTPLSSSKPQQRVGDSYAIKGDDDDVDEVATPNPKRDEDSLIDFFRNISPQQSVTAQPIAAAASSATARQSLQSKNSSSAIRDSIRRTAIPDLNRKKGRAAIDSLAHSHGYDHHEHGGFSEPGVAQEGNLDVQSVATGSPKDMNNLILQPATESVTTQYCQELEESDHVSDGEGFNAHSIANALPDGAENVVPQLPSEPVAPAQDEQHNIFEQGVARGEFFNVQVLPTALLQGTGSSKTRGSTSSNQQALLLFSYIQRSALYSLYRFRQLLGRVSRRFEQPVVPGKTRVRWTCTCGQDLYDDFIELRAGAAAAMELELRKSFSTSNSTTGPSDPVQDILAPTANSEDTNSNLTMPAAAHQTPLPHSSTTNGFPHSPTMPAQMPAPELQSKSAATPAARLSEARWLLLCVRPPKLPTSLTHLDLYLTFNDKKFFSTLKESYAAIKGKWHSLLSLRGVKTIQFVQFELHPRDFVDVRKSPDILPKGMEDDYIYQPYDPDLLPPVGEELMTHLFYYPSHAHDRSITCRRAPMKRRRRLTVCPDKGTNLGWGIHLVEGIVLGRALWLLFAIFTLGSLAFGVSWSLLKHDISGAFGVASWIVTFGGLAAALLQATLD